MKNRISITDFTFKFKSYGRYFIAYQSPITGETWCNFTTDMPLIDATKNCDYPKIMHLNKLKKLCKSTEK